MNLNKSRNNTQILQKMINTIVYDFYDCSLCNLCCIDGVLYLDKKDIKNISRYLKISQKSFVEKYAKYNIKTGEIKINMPCCFLKNNKCIIYQVRPKVCRDYPIFVQDNDIVYVYGIETCAIATHFFKAYTDFLSKNYPEFYKQLEKNIEKCPTPKNDNMINIQFSKYHIELLIKWLNK